MLTEQEIKTIFGKREDEVTIIDNPAYPSTDATLGVIAQRMLQFIKSKHMNPHRVIIEDFDVASAFSDDPKNPIDGNYYFYIFRHKVTGRTLVAQNSAKYGWMIPFGIVAKLSELAVKE